MCKREADRRHFFRKQRDLLDVSYLSRESAYLDNRPCYLDVHALPISKRVHPLVYHEHVY
jgi:hypothetical protein